MLQNLTQALARLGVAPLEVITDCDAVVQIGRIGREGNRLLEKFERRVWDRARPESLADFIGVLNRARRDNPALQSDAGLRFLAIDNEQLIAYAKTSSDRSNIESYLLSKYNL